MINEVGVAMYRAGRPTWPSLNPGPGAVSHTLGWAVLDLVDAVERWHGSPGVGANNIHIDTARAAEAYLGKIYPGTTMSKSLFQGKPMPEVIAYLFTTGGNIHYAAATLRMLADLRTGKTESHIGRLTDTDMAIIYGAYRSGVQSYGGLDGYQAASVPGSMGQIFREFLRQYREYRGR